MVTKQAISVNFASGLDTKTDPWQLAVGKFLALDNMVFTTGNRLTKRNGYATLPALPDNSFTYITTLNGNLTAMGPTIAAFNPGSQKWVPRGSIQPCTTSTLPLIRNNINQTQPDCAVAPNGLVCTAYTETNGSTTDYRYAIADSITGQNVVAPTPIPAGAGAISGSSRVFILGNFFVIVFTNTIAGASHLQYISIPIYSPTTTPTTNEDIAAAYAASTRLSWDGAVYGGNLYLAYATSAPAVHTTYLTVAAVAVGGPPAASVSVTPTSTPTILSLCLDITAPTNPIAYISYFISSTAYTFSVFANATLTTNFTPQEISSSGVILNIASAAQNGVCTVFMENSNNYPYDSSVPSHYTNGITITEAGVVGTLYTAVRSVGIGSKAFIINGTIYFLATFQSPFQPTYFLINGSLSVQAAPIVAAKLAYENGGGYYGAGLPSVTVTGLTAQISYLNKDFISSLSNSNAAGTAVTGGVYSQTGINLATLNLTPDNIDSAEIGSTLQFGGGFLWMYDGYLPVEHNFFLWPDSVEVTTSGTGGSLAAQQYFYQAVYEWSDNQGNIYRSAGSIPVTITTTGSTSANTVHVPTLRLTYKISNPVKVTIYRYSAGQEIWYEVTSITSPTLNDTTMDAIAFVDTAADASISGNPILYTTGGVVEDINAPSTNIMTLFDDRLWMVDAEDPNLLWFSKQVIEATPVEMSDLFTFFVAPTTGAQGSTGPITALSPMDDKLIVFKQNAIYYINGTGPDNTGANNQYSQPIFITSVVGCANQQSIVFMPSGLMFQSDKGIWLLGRDLSTQYIGAGVEQYNSILVNSAINVPATNQVRFTLESGITLMYDYYYSQWGTFSGVAAVSSTVYEELHTYISSLGATYQESEGLYLDGSNPVNMSFTTSWLNLAGLQGYQRAYFFYILGEYLSPHKLSISVAFDYNPTPTQTSLIMPINGQGLFGSNSPFGQGSPMAGSAIEDWRVFLAQQRCQAFQITLQEQYDPSQGLPAGAGLTLSGINVITGFKRGWRTIGAPTSVGGGTNVG